MFVLILVLAWLSMEALFFITHQRPLTDAEIRKLSSKRKKRYINRTFRFTSGEVAVDKNFKSTMSPRGKLYYQTIHLQKFPAYIASLLKGKKHEWVIIGLVKDEKIVAFWANKGDDNESVCFTCELDEIIALCKRHGCHSIIRLHNHPNGDPQHYTCLVASPQDKISAQVLSKEVAAQGLNWLDFVCERGNFIEYFRSISEKFIPSCASPKTIINQNNVSGIGNYKLHRELGVFRKW